MIRVAVVGAEGRMGKETVRAVRGAPDLMLVGAWDEGHDLASELAGATPDVAVEFTTPGAVAENLRILLSAGVRPVVGTTGLSRETLDETDRVCREKGIGGLVAPNFSIGAVLMMRFAAEAARHLPHVEIVELHHDRKLDAPSGTALKTAEGIAAARERTPEAPAGEESIAGVRGGEGAGGIRIHSVRLPGLVAHQEVVFGGPGQTLRIRHDSLDRAGFMPGVLLAVRRVVERVGLVRDLGELL
jgi:4-hydroxy-tetrahydrodipicolinate reductase